MEEHDLQNQCLSLLELLSRVKGGGEIICHPNYQGECIMAFGRLLADTYGKAAPWCGKRDGMMFEFFYKGSVYRLLTDSSMPETEVLALFGETGDGLRLKNVGHQSYPYNNLY